MYFLVYILSHIGIVIFRQKKKQLCFQHHLRQSATRIIYIQFVTMEIVLWVELHLNAGQYAAFMPIFRYHLDFQQYLRVQYRLIEETKLGNSYLKYNHLLSYLNFSCFCSCSEGFTGVICETAVVPDCHHGKFPRSLLVGLVCAGLIPPLLVALILILCSLQRLKKRRCPDDYDDESTISSLSSSQWVYFNLRRTCSKLQPLESETTRA